MSTQEPDKEQDKEQNKEQDKEQNKEPDIVVIGIGHSSLYENAQSNTLTPLGLKELAIQHGAYNQKLDRVTEYRFCSALAKKIVEKLAEKKDASIIGMTANRYIGWDINGHSRGERDMGAAIRAINREIGKQKGRIKAAIDLHLNAGWSADKAHLKGYFVAYHSKADLSTSLSRWLGANITKVMGFDSNPKKVKYLASSPENAKVAGMGFPRSVKVPAVLLELFFADSNSDLERGLNNFDALADAIVTGLISFCKNEEIPFDPSNIIEDTKVKSSALVLDKLKPQFNDEQVKEIAIETQRKLTPIERTMGEGGDKYSFKLKNEIEIIGVKPPPFASTRIDGTGKVFTKPVVRPGGISYLQKTYPKFQNVDITSDIPVGRKHIFAHTEFAVHSYEILLNAYGNIDIEGPGNVRVAAGQQVDVISGCNLNFEADTVVTISANDIVTQGDSSISGNLRVTGGVTIGGSAYINGGVYSPSFNGPAKIDKTNSVELLGYMNGEWTATDASSVIEAINGPMAGTIKLASPVAEGATELAIKEIILAGGSLNVTIDTLTIPENNLVGNGHGDDAIVQIPGHLHHFRRLNGELKNTSAEIQTEVAKSVN